MAERTQNDLERAIIHDCMNDTSKMEEAIQQITENDFLDPKHKTIFRAIKEIAMQNRTPSFIILTQHIENSKDRFEDVAQYLSDIDSDIRLNTYDDFSYCIDVLKSNAEARRQLYVLKEAEQMILKKSSNADVTDFVISSFNKIEDRSSSGMKNISVCVKDLHSEYVNGKTQGYKTGYPKLDYLTGGFKKGQMIVLGANTGIGKTSFAFSIAHNIAKHYSVLYVSREMGFSEMAMRYVALETDIKMQNMNNCNLSVIDQKKLGDLGEKESGLYIDEQSSKLSEVYAKAKKLQRGSGEIGLIVIDYLQLMDYGKDKNEVQALDRLSKEIKDKAKELQVPILVLSQFSKEAYNSSKLTKQYLRGSGAIYFNADFVLLIDRQEGEEEAWLIIDKARNSKVGKIKMHFNGEKTEYLEVDDFFGTG